MIPTIGSTIEWKRWNGKMSRMVVDLIHSVDDEIWLFGWLGNSWSAVNQKTVLVVRRER